MRHSRIFHPTLEPVWPDISFELSVHMEIFCSPLVYALATLAAASLSLARRITLPDNVPRSTHSVSPVPAATLVFLPSTMATASFCSSVTGLLFPSLVHTSSFSGCSSSWVHSFLSRSITGSMILTGCVLGAVRSLYSYLCCLLLSTDTAGCIPTSCTTTPVGADQNIPIMAHPCLLMSF